METSEELKQLAAILADWVAGRPLTVFIYGSRVRGDHRPDSDVDIHIRWDGEIDRPSMDWWGAVNDEHFATINSLLPGPLQILVEADPLHYVIEASPLVYEDRKVRCVLMPKR